MAEIVSMPKLGFDMAEGILVRWVKKTGDQVRKGDVVAEIETDKATVEVESPYEGTLLQHLVEQSTSVPVGDPIAVIGAAGEKVDMAVKTKPAEPVLPAGWPTSTNKDTPVMKETAESTVEKDIHVSPPAGTPITASPLARKMARDADLNLVEIKGSGPSGRIVRKDVEAHLNRLETRPGVSPGTLPVKEAQVIPVNKLRAAIGRRMVESKTSIPHFYVTHQFLANKLMELRKEINQALADNEKISVNDLVIKATALALRSFPNLNASITEKEIVLHPSINIGVAVSVEGGLLTVVVKDADRKPLSQISREVKEMAARVKQGKVRPEDVEGSTFSISNLGMYDVEEFGAIINPPEAAILAVASIHEAPVVVDGELRVGQVFKATLSADHRLTDGVEAARFMQELARYVEHPLAMLI